MRPAAFAIAALVCACGPSGPSTPDGGCADVLPSACSPAAPSYAHDVAPLVSAHCLACHAPGGPSADKPLGSYAELYSRRTSALVQLHACRMPPANAPSALKEAGRHTLELWLVCGAPEN